VTTLDVVRAARLVSGIVGMNPVDTPITIIGGYSGSTIVPLLSQLTFGKGILFSSNAELGVSTKVCINCAYTDPTFTSRERFILSGR
jgi:malate/lactate dehydrogenase